MAFFEQLHIIHIFGDGCFIRQQKILETRTRN